MINNYVAVLLAGFQRVPDLWLTWPRDSNTRKQLAHRLLSHLELWFPNRVCSALPIGQMQVPPLAPGTMVLSQPMVISVSWNSTHLLSASKSLVTDLQLRCPSLPTTLKYFLNFINFKGRVLETGTERSYIHYPNG